MESKKAGSKRYEDNDDDEDEDEDMDMQVCGEAGAEEVYRSRLELSSGGHQRR